MPLYTFKCNACGDEIQKILSVNASYREHCKACGKPDTLERQLPQGISSTTMETKDPYRGVQQPKDLQKQLKKRMRDHHDKYEVEEKIDRHGMDDALRHGWTKKRKL